MQSEKELHMSFSKQKGLGVKMIFSNYVNKFTRIINNKEKLFKSSGAAGGLAYGFSNFYKL